MALEVYNTLSRRIEDFRPFSGSKVKAYVCGLTVYDDMHIGHARTYLAFDAIFKYLKYRGYSLEYVQNITDVDDKIIQRARGKGVDTITLAEDYIERSREDMESLGLMPASEYPRVTENISGIVDAIEDLIKKGHAYETVDGIYFDVSSFKDYGRLSNQDTEQLNQHRIEPSPNKKSPLDFALWKKASDTEDDSSDFWSHGRPGWHIECSVMALKYLGEQIDIHGGAMDLVFPHHENEIAQSESLTGKKPFVKYWLHTGFLNSSGEKMSKSRGNILSVKEFLGRHSPEALRLFVLQTHYRSPVDYSEEKIVAAEAAVERLRNFRRNLGAALEASNTKGGSEAEKIAVGLKAKFIEYMDDDFNTPQALAAVFDGVREVNRLLDEKTQSRRSLQQAINVFDELTGVLGLSLGSTEESFSEEERRLIEERNKYRMEKNWTEADRIRDTLLQRGVKLIDRGDGSTTAERIR